ncbi:MAG: hypothetical protein WKG00_13935 [Polyangiaceae bacterium]
MSFIARSTSRRSLSVLLAACAALASLALGVRPASANCPEDYDGQEPCSFEPTSCFDASDTPVSCDTGCEATHCYANGGQPRPCPSSITRDCEPGWYCYDALWASTDCNSGCAAAHCFDAWSREIPCDQVNAVQACGPVACFGPADEPLDCATDCDIARCEDAAGEVIPCPGELAFCDMGPPLCCDAERCYDQADDCGLSPEDAWECDEQLQSCATDDDDPGDATDADVEASAAAASMAALAVDSADAAVASASEEAVAAVAAAPPVGSGSSCACAQAGGAVTDCSYEIRFVEFVPVSAPALDRKGDFRIEVDAGRGSVYLSTNDWGGSGRTAVGTKVGVHKSVASVAVPCGSSRNATVKVKATEVDSWGPDEKGETTITLPLTCPGGQPVSATQRIQLENKRHKVKHEIDVTVEAVVSNRCAAVGAVPTCSLPPGGPAAGCEYEVFATQLFHRESPALDEKGRFNGWFNPKFSADEKDWVFFPPFKLYWEPYKQWQIKRGTAQDMTAQMPSPIATYVVPCQSSVTPTIPVSINEHDGLIGAFIGKDDFGTAEITPTLTCPPQETSFYENTEVKLYGNASKPRHVVDVTTLQKVRNLNYCHQEPQQGLVTGCEVIVDVAKVTKVSGSYGDYDLTFQLGDSSRWMTPSVSNANREWTPADDEVSPTIARVAVPCGQAIEAELAIHGEERDWFFINFPSEYGAVSTQLSLPCGAGAGSETKTVRMQFKNSRGKVKDEIDVELLIHRVDDPAKPSCQCRDYPLECGDGICVPGETATGCPEDCTQCNDGLCSGGETASSCPGDCTQCNDGLCTGNETAASCPQDCKTDPCAGIDGTGSYTTELYGNFSYGGVLDTGSWSYPTGGSWTGLSGYLYTSGWTFGQTGCQGTWQSDNYGFHCDAGYGTAQYLEVWASHTCGLMRHYVFGY